MKVGRSAPAFFSHEARRKLLDLLGCGSYTRMLAMWALSWRENWRLETRPLYWQRRLSYVRRR